MSARLRTVVPALTLLIGTLGGVRADEWTPLPQQVLAGWRCTTAPGEQWTAWRGLPGDGAQWQPVAVGTPAPYPLEVEPADQHRWPFVWTPEDVPPGKAVYFRRNFQMPGQAPMARLRVCAYGSLALYLNGERLLHADEEGKLFEVDVTDKVVTGANQLAAAVIRGGKNYGLLVMGEAEFLATDQTWHTTKELGKEDQYNRALQRPGRTPVSVPAWAMPGTALRWDPVEPGLSLEWEGVSYPTMQPVGGMPEYSTAYFRGSLNIDGLPVSGVLQILGDDGYEVYVNGHVVAVEKRADKAYMPAVVDITDYLTCGDNLIAAKVTNDWGPGRIHLQPTIIMQF